MVELFDIPEWMKRRDIKMTYSASYGIWKSVKDAAMNTVAAGTAYFFLVGDQVVTQCPELTLSVLGATFSFKAAFNFLNNYRKNKDN
jgi:hypothetical protein